MRRTGSAAAVGCAVWLTAAGASAAVEVRADADRSEVGLPDTFVLTVRASDAPRGSSLGLPEMDGAEVLSTSRGMSTSIQVGSSGPMLRQELTLTAVLRPTRVGRLTLAPAELHTPDGVVKSNSVTLTVQRAHVPGPSTARPGRPDLPPFPSPFGDGDDPFAALRDREAARPRAEGDLFLRSEVDHREVFVGEQVTLSFWIYSRVDLSRVDNVGMPKLDGFWSEDIDSPSTLNFEPRTVEGVPYRAYLLKRLALFPIKAGNRDIGPVEADITTGFLFAGHREHRVGNTVTLKVKPLPAGAPPGFVPANVGSYRLSAELSAASAELGSPVTLRVVLEGQGNLKDVVLPHAAGPAALRLYDPTSQDRISPVKGRIQGRRSQEYLVMAQQTGVFQIPALTFAYFDPELRRYETTRTQALTLSVTPGGGGSTVAVPSSSGPDTARNVLAASALRPLRVDPRFDVHPPAWRRPWVVALAVTPPAALVLVSLAGAVSARRARRDPATERRRRTRAARGMLAAAARLQDSGTDAAFSEQVEHAVVTFLQARVGSGLTGLTRQALRDTLSRAGAPETVELCAARVLDTCDAVRFAPGAVRLDRQALLREAERVLEGWE